MAWKHLYARCLSALGPDLHAAAHSHHLWPDATRDAMLACWDDAARLLDRKWDRILGELVPEAQARIAGLLGLPAPGQLAFGPNTHGFVLRLFSCLPPGRRVRVLTTDGEFHSFARQLRRFEEAGLVEAERVPTLPFDSFPQRFRDRLRDGGPELVFLSHAFFDSGLAVRDLSFLRDAPPEALVVVDGYHAFRALPVDLAPVADRVFYLGGGYKYAASGEGSCFLWVPPGAAHRPIDTGWFAELDAVADARSGEVGYRPDGWRFAGATFDPAGLYRFVWAERALEREGVTAAVGHAHVRALQLGLLERLRGLGGPWDPATSPLLPDGLAWHGHFLAFEVPDAPRLVARLADEGVRADARGRRLRLGLGLYHDEDDVDRLARAVRAALT
jgi:kynureninase